MKLQNKVVFITGGSKGLGKALAQTSAREGARVIIAARDEAELKKTTEELNVESVTLDITNEQQVLNTAKQVIATYGRIDIWINNAGIWLPHAPIEEMDMKRVHDMVEVNLFGTMYGSKAALVQMKKQNNGVIVNILSTSALKGRALSSGYCASKYAAVGFTKSLRLAAEDYDINVIAIYPGGMQTNFFDEKKPDNYDKYMKPEEVAQKIVANITSDKPEEEQIIQHPASH